MRNANIYDVKRAVATGMLEENVMYSMNGLRVHGKKTSYMVSHYMLKKGEALVECAEGVLYKALIAEHIQPILSGESQKPKRIKRKPVKGTKPEQLIPMNEGIKLKVGDRVLLENGRRVEITAVDMTDTQYPYYSSYWYDRTGKVTFAEGLYYEGENITHKIIPWHKQNHLYVNGKLIGQVKDLKITVEGESSEQEAFEKGYWVGRSAFDKSVPAWAKGVRINWISDWQADVGEHDLSYSECAEDVLLDSPVVAYRKAKQQ